MSLGSNDPKSLEARLKLDKQKLMLLVQQVATAQRWNRVSGIYQTRLKYLFNYRRESLTIGELKNSIGFHLTPQDAPNALKKIASVFSQFYQKYPTSPLTLTVTLLNINGSRVNSSLRTMLDAGIDIEKIAEIKDKSGTRIPTQELHAMIQEIKSSKANIKIQKP